MLVLELAACEKLTRRAEVSGGGGTLTVTQPVSPNVLLPAFISTRQEEIIVDQIFDRLADLPSTGGTSGDAGFTPRLATSWEWASDSLSIAFHLNPTARWHDGIGVRAADVRYTFKLYRESENSAAVQRIDSVTVRDSLTPVFWFPHRYPEQFYDATYEMRICPAHLLASTPIDRLRASQFARAPVGSGRFRFSSWIAGNSIELVTDTSNFRGRATPDRLVFLFASDPKNSLLSIISGEADVYDAIRADNLVEIAKQPKLSTRSYANPSYAFLQFNTKDGATSHPHPIFGDVRVRMALQMAIDRPRLAQAIFDSLAVVPRGPFSTTSSYGDSTLPQVTFDRDHADQLLDSLGWRRGADGVRARHGQRLAFSIAIPASSQSRARYGVLLQAAFEAVGAEVKIDTRDMRAFGAQLQSHRFDAAIQVIHVDPSPTSLRYGWTTRAATEGFNYGRFTDPRFDSALDSALETPTPTLFRRAYLLLNDAVPAIWLYEERPIIAYNRRWSPAPFGPTGWWIRLADWSLAAAIPPLSSGATAH